jgi:hypothetical protein
VTLLSACCWMHCWPWIVAAAWLGGSVACLAISLVHYGHGTRAEREHAAELEATRVAHASELEAARAEAAGAYTFGKRPPHD